MWKKTIEISSSSDETSFNDDEESHANPSQSDEEGYEDKDEHEEDDSDDDESNYKTWLFLLLINIVFST